MKKSSFLVAMSVLLLSGLLAASVLSQELSKEGRVRLPPVSEASQYVMLTAEVKTDQADELKTFVKGEFLPAVGASRQIVSVRTFTTVIGKNPGFVALFELRSSVPLTVDTAAEVLSADGSAMDEGFAKLERLAEMLDTYTTSIVAYRPDLSVSRDAMAYGSP